MPAFTIADLMLGAFSQAFSTGIGAAALANADKEALLIAQSSLEEVGAGELLYPRETKATFTNNMSVFAPSGNRVTKFAMKLPTKADAAMAKTVSVVIDGDLTRS